MEFHSQALRQFILQIIPLQIAPLPTEQAAGRGVGQHDPPFLIQQNGPISHCGNQGLLLHLGGGELFNIGFVVGLQLGGHGVEALQQFPQLPAHGQGQAGFEVAPRNRAHAPQQLLHRLGDGEGVEHRSENHQNPDRDEHGHGHLPSEGGTGQEGFIGIDPQGHHPQEPVPIQQGHEYIRHLAIGGEVLANQGVVRPLGEIGRQLQSPAQQLVGRRRPIAPRAHRDAQVDRPIRIGKHDVAEAAAGLPEPLCHIRQLRLRALAHQGFHIGGQQQAQIPRVARVAHAGVLLDAVEGKESDARHEQAHHQGGHGKQLGLQAEFRPPPGQPLPPGAFAVHGSCLRTWWPMSRRNCMPSKCTWARPS